MQHFEYSLWIDAPVSVVFAFHERPDAFEKLAPPGQKIQILHRKGGLETGARIEFLTRVGPFPVRWLALHVEYEKDRFFLDEQIRGPFKKWYHRHEFEDERGGTRLTDSTRLTARQVSRRRSLVVSPARLLMYKHEAHNRARS